MPANSKQINVDERNVITELLKNSKISPDNIAKKYGYSRNRVQRIIKKLEKNRAIWGYHAVVSDEQLGLKRYFILIKKTITPVSKDKLDIVITRRLKKEIGKIGVFIDCSFFLHGSFDWLICLSACDVKYVKKFIEIFNELFRVHVFKIEVLEVIFPVEKCGFDNQDLEEIKEFFR